MRGPALVAAAALPLLLAGCFSEILPTRHESKLEFICAVLDPQQAERLVVDAWVGEGIGLDVAAPQAALVAELAEAGSRESGITLERHRGPDVPRRGWNATTLAEWLADQPTEIGDEVHLHVLWVESLGGGTSLLVPASGLVAVAQDAVREGAFRLGVPAEDVARAVLLHAVGHALGAVNLGLPVQDADIRGREGPGGHDPDAASVLHAGWEDPATMAWAADATYDAWPAAVHADWDAAVDAGGVCAA
jgi:hypothetical protein